MITNRTPVGSRKVFEDQETHDDTLANLLAISVTHFELDGHRCFIVPADEAPNDLLPNDELPRRDAPQYVAMGQIIVGARHYLVITTDSDAKQDDSQADQSIAELLTRRELQIALLVSKGRVNKQIAHQLKLSEWTVSTHLRRVYAKLGVRSRAAMVACIMKNSF